MSDTTTSELEKKEKQELRKQMWEYKLVRKDDESFSIFSVFLSSLNKDQINYLLSTIDRQDCQYSWDCAVRWQMLSAATKVAPATEPN